jgi:RND superfamily putative drug exporter
MNQENKDGRLARLAHFVTRHRWWLIAAWVVLTLFGGFAAARVSQRWYQSFSIPGKSAYEANQRTLETFGVGVRPPDVVVFHTRGDATKSDAIKQAMQRVAATMPRALTSSYFSTGSSMFVSRDRHTTFMEVHPAGPATFDAKSGAERLRRAAAAGLPVGTTVQVTGHDPLEEASTHGDNGGSSVLLEAMIGGIGALVILLFVFGTLPAVLMPLVVAVSAILNTFTLVWGLTYLTNVSIIVEFLIALVGLGVAIDYALLMIFRFRDELREGADVESAIVETMTHAGRAVIVSGSTVAVGFDARAAVAVHPFDGHRRHVDSRRLGARRDHTAACHARRARRSDQQRASPAEAARRPRSSGGWSLGSLGALRAAAAGRGRGDRDRHRRRARLLRRAVEPERGAAEELSRQRHGD